MYFCLLQRLKKGGAYLHSHPRDCIARCLHLLFLRADTTQHNSLWKLEYLKRLTASCSYNGPPLLSIVLPSLGYVQTRCLRAQSDLLPPQCYSVISRLPCELSTALIRKFNTDQ
jgi:hypothetical protein